MKKLVVVKTRVKASTMIEMLVVMIITGIVIGLTFEGVDIFRRFSRKVTNEIVKSDDLLNQYLSLHTIVDRSDSLTFDRDVVLLYRKGSVFGELYREDSSLLVNLSNTIDTLPINVASLDVRLGVQADTLIVETETITLVFASKEQPVIPTKKNMYDKSN